MRICNNVFSHNNRVSTLCYDRGCTFFHRITIFVNCRVFFDSFGNYFFFFIHARLCTDSLYPILRFRKRISCRPSRIENAVYVFFVYTYGNIPVYPLLYNSCFVIIHFIVFNKNRFIRHILVIRFCIDNIDNILCRRCRGIRRFPRCGRRRRRRRTLRLYGIMRILCLRHGPIDRTFRCIGNGKIRVRIIGKPPHAARIVRTDDIVIFTAR